MLTIASLHVHLAINRQNMWMLPLLTGMAKMSTVAYFCFHTVKMCNVCTFLAPIAIPFWRVRTLHKYR